MLYVRRSLTVAQSADGSTRQLDDNDQLVNREFTDDGYEYLGIDVEGYHHHYDKVEEIVYRTDQRYEEFTRDGSVVIRYRICGEVERAVDLVDESTAPDDTEMDDPRIYRLRCWLEFVDQEIGWKQRTPSLRERLGI